MQVLDDGQQRATCGQRPEFLDHRFSRLELRCRRIGRRSKRERRIRSLAVGCDGVRT